MIQAGKSVVKLNYSITVHSMEIRPRIRSKIFDYVVLRTGSRLDSM